MGEEMTDTCLERPLLVILDFAVSRTRDRNPMRLVRGPRDSS